MLDQKVKNCVGGVQFRNIIKMLSRSPKVNYVNLFKQQ